MINSTIIEVLTVVIVDSRAVAQVVITATRPDHAHAKHTRTTVTATIDSVLACYLIDTLSIKSRAFGKLCSDLSELAISGRACELVGRVYGV